MESVTSEEETLKPVDDFEATESEVAEMLGEAPTTPPPGAITINELLDTAFEIIGENAVLNRINAKKAAAAVDKEA